MKTKIAEAIPEHWAELDEEVRSALIEQAKDRIFWKGVAIRLGKFSKIAQILMIIIAFFAVLRSGAADLILGARK